MNNIKRNKKVFEYLAIQAKRLGILEKELYEAHIYPFLQANQVIKLSKIQNITHLVLEDDEVLIESLKTIGLMEASDKKSDLEKLTEKRKKIKDKKKPLTDFDKLLKGIMKVPKEDRK